VKLEAVKISVSWVQFESRCWLVAPGTELLVSCSCMSYCKSQSNRYGKQQAAFAFHHLFTLKNTSPLSEIGDDFPRPSKPRRNCYLERAMSSCSIVAGILPCPSSFPLGFFISCRRRWQVISVSVRGPLATIGRLSCFDPSLLGAVSVPDGAFHVKHLFSIGALQSVSSLMENHL
jgi:hypothetical protein